MNLLLVNLTRFGDLLQTQPVVHGLRAQGHRVGLVCLENFAGAAALLEGVDHVAALPGSALLAGRQAARSLCPRCRAEPYRHAGRPPAGAAAGGQRE
jgi:ADP-heptose:LPS heptosyltransferase